MTTEKHRLGGMAGFLIVWLGQIISVLASGMTQFALTIWMYQQTSSATALGLMQVFYIVPFLVISPIAGVMVDRYNRKLMMMISDLAAGLGTVMILVLQSQGRLEFWMLYFVSALIGLGGAFQWPAYSAAISTMVPKEQYGRANGLMTLMEAGPGVVAPLLAGAMLPIIGLTGILAFDVITFVLAIGALLVVHVPQPPKTVEGQKESGNFFKEALYGFTYIFARPSLLGLQLVFMFGNLFTGIGFTVLAPMVLERTSNNPAALGAVMTAGAVGAVVGGIGMSIWGGFKRRVHGVLGGWIVTGLGFAMFGLGQTLPVWILFAMLASLVGPADQCLQPVHLDGQGRAGCAGTRLLLPPPDRLVHPAHFADHRRHAGGLRAGTCHDGHGKTADVVRSAGGDDFRFRDEFLDRVLRDWSRAGGCSGVLRWLHP